ncbi:MULTISPECIES: TetR/AcrR family transcriptional regulator [Streptomyces]|uniref:Helix-turn-helix transcriptional regulator n=2 Tax=Streptomyces rimosus subsp. rimosus TaxID=132474 RepID=L8EE23_STRR1|nr:MULTISPECIES: helix-turn-helix domain-containing protein [Streptomyces]KOG79493.1 TetR family transcriptional regulator [Kitasatospora aureofaciens]MYT43095.1 TetR family transcriptional regulator [Streptomyces sp. SID5471]KOT43051.1 TetR family transcriptional regulator [Streptomyces rimosus subsp. rimosus]KOT43761.1 TetR family transcriptional regulator [Streptomyces sp. NRRL WC-3701]KOT63340.1 TetR family transcriptional regulator [Streptomyces rimosus subsp. rimosus]
MHIQGSQWPTAVSAAAPTSETRGNGTTHSAAGGRSTPLRVDAQRNLEHVLRAAREVFGELGYGAPMEDVARRARVGVGTVYRRFPSKDVLVRRIAEEETSRLTEQARTALGQEDDPWSALSRFLRTSVASGAGRLLPPSILRVSTDASGGPEAGEPRVPQQRSAYGSDGRPGVHADGGTGAAAPGDGAAVPADLPSGASAEFRVVAQRGAPEAESSDAPATVPNGITSAAANGVSTRGAAATSTLEAPAAPSGGTAADGGAQALLEVVGQLVERARAAGELRADVTVADVLLVIATGAPSLPDPAQQQAASARLLEILLEGLRSRPAG